ncbi:hypothetical protein TKK_0003725 [Trichogramma kaykai]
MNAEKIIEMCMGAFRNKLNHNYFDKSLMEIGRINRNIISTFAYEPKKASVLQPVYNISSESVLNKIKNSEK